MLNETFSLIFKLTTLQKVMRGARFEIFFFNDSFMYIYSNVDSGSLKKNIINSAISLIYFLSFYLFSKMTMILSRLLSLMARFHGFFILIFDVVVHCSSIDNNHRFAIAKLLWGFHSEYQDHDIQK